jgi:hypothetical protein
MWMVCWWSWILSSPPDRRRPPRHRVINGDAALTVHYGDFRAGRAGAGLRGLRQHSRPGDRRHDRGAATVHRGWRHGHLDPAPRRADLVPTINAWFAQHGFELAWLSARHAGYGVGVHRFTGAPQPLRTDRRLFTFTHG